MKIKATAEALRKKTYKYYEQWMPSDPCEHCGAQIPCESCKTGESYQDMLSIQKKLLKYMVANSENGAFFSVGRMRSMIKHLEVHQ